MTSTPALLAKTLVMSVDALLRWKSQIFDYQQRTPRKCATTANSIIRHCPKALRPRPN
ncbi:hypothetical protein [Tolypothrix sp. NIES-4075]|uniref:hypothetical protein n=1 Tax=Tolypothrix sp. NIES-4075 TaxID=2005459 RepID=UPI001357CC3E|nr:hypothetical protein [Tolypothrix sp. NIES-4075]